MSKKDEMPITRKMIDALVTAVGLTALTGFSLNLIWTLFVWVVVGHFDLKVYDYSLYRGMIVFFFVSWFSRFMYLHT